MILARLFVFVGGLIVLALTTALVAPYFIDWTSYRAAFEREASAVLGRKVTVEGPAEARLLPFPSVSFSDVSVGGGLRGEPAMTVETFSMDAELAPFLRGEFLIFDMRMVRPRAIVDIGEDGMVDWAVRPSSPIPASKIALEKLTVTDGRVEIRHRPSGRTHVVSGIETELSAKSLAGPWRLDGTLAFDGEAAAVSAATGVADPDGRLRLRVKLAPAKQPVSLDADGEVALKPEGLVYFGGFRLTEAAVKPAAAEGEAQPVRQEAPRYRLNGQFILDSRKLDLAAFRFESGPLDHPYTADGMASLDFGAEPRFTIKASGAQMRIDEALGADQGASLSLEQRLRAFTAAMLALPKPTIPGSISFDLPAVVAGDTTIRDVRLAAEPAAGGWSIKSTAATLPGRTTLEADGFLRTEGEFGFDGNLLIAVAQPSGFAAWVARDIDEAIRRLPAAGFSARVEMTERRQLFRDLELALGKARFRGEIDSRQPADARPSVLVKLDGDALDVDGLSAFASLFVTDAGSTRFGTSDLDLQVRAGPVDMAGLSAETIDTALRLRAGRLEIDRLSIGGLAGASISATGTIEGFPEKPAGNVDASIVSVDLAPLAGLLAEKLPDHFLVQQLQRRVAAFPGLLADARLDVVADARRGADGQGSVELRLDGAAGGSQLAATLSGKGAPEAIDDADMSLSLSARNDDATALLALAGLPALPLGVTGAGELTASAKGTLTAGLESAATLKGDQFLATFTGTSTLDHDGFSAKGRTSLEAADIEPWLMTTGMSLPGMGLGTSAHFSANADLGSGLLVLDGIDGVVNETAVAGDLNVGLVDGVPSLDGALVLDELPLEPFASMIVGQEALASEDGGWPVAPFARKLVLPFTASLDISAATLTAGSAAAYDATLALGLDNDGLRITDLKATYAGGALGGRFELKNNDGTALFSGQLQLGAAELSEAVAGGLAGKGNLSATVTGNGKSIEALVASLSGSGTASARGLGIQGISDAALPVLLARADAIGRDIDAGKVAGFAPEIVGAGAFAGGDADAAFTIAAGVLRTPPVMLGNPRAQLTAELRGDFNTGETSANGGIAYAAGEAALTGSEPGLNFSVRRRSGAAEVSFDSGPLAQFLTQRALEREQERVEAMQAALVEKQRLRREVRYYAALQAERERLAAEALRKAEEEARRRAEAEARRKAEEEENRRRAEEEARAAAQAARQKLEEEARAAEQVRLRAEEEEFRRIVAEEAARKAAEQRAADEERKRAAAFRRPADEAAPLPADPGDVPLPAPRQDVQPLRPAPPAPQTIESFIDSLTGG